MPATALDFLRQRLRRRLREARDDSQPAGVGDSGDQLRPPYPLHAALHDRIADPEQVGHACAHTGGAAADLSIIEASNASLYLRSLFKRFIVL